MMQLKFILLLGSLLGTQVALADPASWQVGEAPIGSLAAGKRYSTGKRFIFFVADQDGKIVTSATNTMTYVFDNTSNTAASFSAEIGLIQNGVVALSNPKVDKPGVGFGLNVTSAGLQSVSVNFDVALGSAAGLEFGTQPVSTSAGSTIPVTVRVIDAGGNLITAGTYSVTLGVNAGPGGIITGATSVDTVAGVATFSNSIGKAGSYALGATATGLSGANSNTFTIGVGSTTKLVIINAPTSAVANNISTLEVSVQDLYGNTKDDNTTEVTLSRVGGGALSTLAPSLTRPAVGGIVTFTMAVPTTGTTALSVAATGVTGASTSNFEVVPYLQTWSATTTTGAPSARSNATAVWTGSKMIIWGGSTGFYQTGAQYDPVANSWSATTTTGAPTGRYDHGAVWTGTKMLIWGGWNGSYLNTGGQYDPVANSWSTITTTGAPTGSRLPTAVWTGSKMIVWGGLGSSSSLNSGGQYNPETNTWSSTSTTGAPSARFLHTAVWSGTKMIIWGGYAGPVTDTGGQYNPETDTWSSTSTTGAPSARSYHTAVWTSTKMIVWGGYASTTTDTGGQYNPETDTWSSTSTTGAPSARYVHTAVWTGNNMIIWAGDTGINTNTGGLYNPSTDIWVATSSSGTPEERYAHTAVWTSTKMIVWGGNNPTTINTGGMLDPGDQ